jgi:hypothetical protein
MMIMTNTISNRPLRIFLCHSSEDKPAVRKLHRRLTANGFAPWLDEEDLLPGHDWQYEIPKAVRQSDVVIVCLSPQSSNKEGYIQKEIKFALDAADEKPEGTIFLIPLKLEECNVPERLSRWQCADLFSPNGYRDLLRALRQLAADLNIPISDAIAQANSFFSKAGFAIKRIDFELGDMLVSMSKWISHSQYGDILVRVIKGDLSGEYVRSVEQRGKALGASGKIVYVVYEGELLSDAFLQIGTFRLGNDLHVVPLKSSVISEALVSEGKNCYRVLEALEKEYVGHGNPYEYSNAITDPTLFFGRRDAVDRVLNRLRSQQHAGIFGMRKSGKTSLMYYIRQNLSRDSVPFAWLGLQSTSSVDPKHLFADVLRQLRYFLHAKGVTDTPALKLLSGSSQTDTIQAFREDILTLWEVAKGELRVPFMVIMIDEVERIVPTPHSGLIAYQHYDEFFAPIRDLAQIERCLFTVVTGEKPVIREEFDTSRFPSNAMFELYDEGYLPFFTPKECADMVSKIGKLIDIDFSNEAQNQIYRESAGHPYIARVLCACIVDSMEKGREVSTSAVELGVPTALDNLDEYFKSLWMKTTSDEKEVIRSVLTRREPVSNFNEQQRDVVRLLQKLGLIQQRADEAWEISINLFARWLEQRIGQHV